MSDDVGSHPSDPTHDDDGLKDLMTHCLQLVDHSQWKSKRTFLCGSFVEIPYCHDICKQLEINKEDMFDIDGMSYDTSRYAFQCSVTLPETYNGSNIRLDTNGVHAGYVRLIKENNNQEQELLLSDLHTQDNEEERKGPALRRDYKKRELARKFSFSIADVDRCVMQNIRIRDFDKVYAVHSPCWPVEANEWITRRRPRGFPSKSVIEQIVKYGCDFVQVSHNRLCKDNEWRFSFSRAELFIAKSWSIPQKIVYTTLSVLNKKIACFTQVTGRYPNSNLSTYYFKTLMFWACEEKPSQFWSKDLLVQSVCELLTEMLKCFKSKFCANYFIPGNNMMDHLKDTNLSYEIYALCRISQSFPFISEVIDKWRTDKIYHIWLPAWIKRAFVIYERVNNDYDTFQDLFSTTLTIDLGLHDALIVELSDIFEGLRYQQKFVNSVSVTDRHVYFLMSENCLLFAVKLCESLERIKIDNCSEEFFWSISRHFMSRDIDVYCRTYCHKTQLSTDNDLRRQIDKGRNVNMEIYVGTDVKFYQEWPGRSPTVNISWFIAKAYLANLYYATQHDVSLTIQVCNDIINVYRQSKMNERFAEKTFPVILSTQWTNIYDKEIQELLGFYFLCSYVLDKCSSRSVYLGVCPVQFALYVKRRTLCLCEISHRFSERCSIDKCIDEYNDHSEKCLCKGRVGNGSYTLNRALIISEYPKSTN